MGELLSFPEKLPKPHCGNCEYAALTHSGVYCMLFRYEVFDEREAADCEAYDPVDIHEPVIIHPSR